MSIHTSATIQAFSPDKLRVRVSHYSECACLSIDSGNSNVDAFIAEAQFDDFAEQLERIAKQIRAMVKPVEVPK